MQTPQRSPAAGHRLEPSDPWSATPLEPSPPKPVSRPSACRGAGPSSHQKPDGFSAVPAAKTAADSICPPPPRKHQAAPLAAPRSAPPSPARSPNGNSPPTAQPPPRNDVKPGPRKPEHALALGLSSTPPFQPWRSARYPLRGVTRNFTPPNGAELQPDAALCNSTRLPIRRGQPGRRLPRLPIFHFSIERHPACGPRLPCPSCQPPWFAPRSAPMLQTAPSPPVALQAAHAARGRLHPLEKRNGWCSLPRGWRLQPAALHPHLALIRADRLDPCDSMCYHADS